MKIGVRWCAIITSVDDVEMARAIITKPYMNMLDDVGWTPLTAAVIHHAHKILALLIEMGADVHAKSPNLKRTLLHEAVAMDNHKGLATLLSLGRIPLDARSFRGYTALHLAVGWHQEECVKLLLDAGANARLLDGQTNQSTLDHWLIHNDDPTGHRLVGEMNRRIPRRLILAGARWVRTSHHKIPRDLRVYRVALAVCKLASRALGRALYLRGICRDLCHLMERMVWETHDRPESLKNIEACFCF